MPRRPKQVSGSSGHLCSKSGLHRSSNTPRSHHSPKITAGGTSTRGALVPISLPWDGAVPRPGSCRPPSTNDFLERAFL